MVKKRVDGRVQGLIEQGVRSGHRSLFVLVGDHGKDQVENLHKILSKARVKSRPSVLWCYKKELGFSTNKQKRLKEIKRNQARGLHDPDRDDPFDLFISSTDIRWTYYKETEKILGQTFGMCVLQDFEALTPNLLARTIETVEGGGLVILLLKTVKSLKQLYSLSMDVHSRFRTEAHHEIVPRFNERFILSIGECSGCLVLDDELNILPISSSAQFIPSVDGFGLGGGGIGSEGSAQSMATSAAAVLIERARADPELVALKTSLESTPHVGNLVALAVTMDQAKAVLAFLDAISEKTLRATVSLSASRGRGKSAAIGLCLAGAIAFGYSNVFVTAPSPENLQATFAFLSNGLKALKYIEHTDFEVLYESGEHGKYPVRINIFRDHRQTVQYIVPSNHAALAQAELVAIDEAAAIPLPVVKKLLGPYLVFLSSTIHGYEGTGRALSLKLVQQLRAQRGADAAAAALGAGAAVAGGGAKKGARQLHEERWKVAAEAAARNTSGRTLTEITLDAPIRYKAGDPVEKWLNALLCLDVATHTTRIVQSMPAPRDCELYMVNRDALFSYHSLAESLLQRIWALYTSAHYKNSPNDLQMLSDAPAHRLFVLLGPQGAASSKPGSLPDVLCVVQVAFEGLISQRSVQSELSRGNRASGDLIPWSITQQFGDSEFPQLSGARVVRIASHPDVQKMGYGSRALDLLVAYFEGSLSSEAGPRPAIGVFGSEGTTNVDSLGGGLAGGSASEGLLEEEIKPRTKLPPLLVNLSERPAEQLHWLGASFGLTSQLLNFWSRKQFRVCYVRQTSNDLTGENSSIVLRELDCSGLDDAPRAGWLEQYKNDYRRRLVSLLGISFSSIDAPLAIALIDPDRCFTSAAATGGGADEDTGDGAVDGPSATAVTVAKTGFYSSEPLLANELLSVHFSLHDMKRLELYARNMVDHHMILDALPTLARLFFQGRIPQVRVSYLQLAIFIAVGLQHKSVDTVSSELDLPSNQVLAFFNKTIRKIVTHLRGLVEAHVSKEMPSDAALLSMSNRAGGMRALKDTLRDDQRQDEKQFAEQQRLKAAGAPSSGGLLKLGGATIPSSISLPKAAPEEGGGGGGGADEGGKQGHSNSHSGGKKQHKQHKHKREGDRGGQGEGEHKKKHKHG